MRFAPSAEAQPIVLEHFDATYHRIDEHSCIGKLKRCSAQNVDILTDSKSAFHKLSHCLFSKKFSQLSLCLLKDLSNEDLTIKFQRAPSHAEVLGNEKVDLIIFRVLSIPKK